MSSLAPLKQVVIVQYDFDLKAYGCLVSLKHFSASSVLVFNHIDIGCYVQSDCVFDR